MSVVLSEHLPLLASAPDGIKKVRGLILELAVRGKLVPQDPKDEPASELLKRIAKERARLEAEGVCRKAKQEPKVREDEQPFSIPGNWAWVRLSVATNKITDGTHHSPPNLPQGEFKYISAKNIKSWGVDLSGMTYVTKEIHEEIYSRCNPEFGDVLYIKDGATTGVAAVNTLTEPFSMLSSVALLKPSVGLFNRFLYFLMTSPVFYQEMRAGMTGVAITRVTLAKLNAAVLPLPPLAEQHRIVAKVDELMALCDLLEAEQTDATSAHAKLVETLLGTLTQSRDADELSANWQRLSQHFDILFSTEASLDALKQTILQLAVMGKLVPQDAKDEPASELGKLIAKARVKLEAAGICKKAKASLPVNPDEYPYLLPEGWEWIRLGTLLTKIGAGSTPLGGKQGYVGEGTKFLRSQNVWNDGLRLDNVALIPPEVHLKMSGTHVEAGDLLFNITGASIGRCAVVPESFDTGNVSQHVTIIRLVTPDIRQFMHCVLISNLVQQTVMDVQVGVSREGLSIGKLAQFIIPFPPLAEQHRIVAKVDELMALCDGLKADLAEARTRQARLSTTLIDAALKAA